MIGVVDALRLSTLRGLPVLVAHDAEIKRRFDAFFPALSGYAAGWRERNWA